MYLYQGHKSFVKYKANIKLTLPPHIPPSATEITPMTLTTNVLSLISRGTLIPFKKHFTAGIPEPFATGYILQSKIKYYYYYSSTFYIAIYMYTVWTVW